MAIKDALNDYKPEIPDDPAGITYAWPKNGLDGWVYSGTNTVSFSDGCLVVDSTGNDPIINRATVFDTSIYTHLIFRAKIESGTPVTEGGYLYAGGYHGFTVPAYTDYEWHIYDIYLPDVYVGEVAFFRFDMLGAPGRYKISDIYIGTGAYLSYEDTVENKWLSKQLTSPIASKLDYTADQRFKDCDLELDYMRGISIDTAEPDVLANIGKLVGLPWPSAPAGTFDNNRFTYGAVATFPTVSNLKGFSGIGLSIGGGLSSTEATTSVVMPVEGYRALLKLIARAKVEGFSLKVFDDLVRVFVNTMYTMDWNADKDLVCSFHPVIDTGPLFIIQKVVDLMTISPRVIIEQAANSPPIPLRMPTGMAWRNLDAAPNGSVYACARLNGIYAQYNGIGAFELITDVARAWTGIAVAPNGDVYACEDGGDIYVQNGGIGAFVALNQTSRAWTALTCVSNGDVYACVYGGDVYKRSGGSGDFIALGQTSRSWASLATAPNDDIYAVDLGGDIYIKTAGSTVFAAIGVGTNLWTGVTVSSNGDLYVSAYGDDVYRLPSGSASLLPLGWGIYTSGYKGFEGLAITSGDNIYVGIDTNDIYYA